MSDERHLALVIAQAALLNCDIAAMQAENQQRAHRGEAMAYVEADFVSVKQSYEGVLGWNAVINGEAR